MRLAKNQDVKTVQVSQWVLHRFQWYLVESIDAETGELTLIGDDGETATATVSQLDGIGEVSK